MPYHGSSHNTYSGWEKYLEIGNIYLEKLGTYRKNVSLTCCTYNTFKNGSVSVVSYII